MINHDGAHFNQEKKHVLLNLDNKITDFVIFSHPSTIYFFFEKKYLFHSHILKEKTNMIERCGACVHACVCGVVRR